MIEQVDLSLIQNILEGDSQSEKVLYDKYKKIVTDFLQRKYPNNNYLEDDVSEILIKVFAALDSYKSDRSKFKSWVFTIAKNHMIDKSRSPDILTGTITIDGSNIEFFNNGCTTTDTIYLMAGDYTTTYSNSFENCDAVEHVLSQVDTCDGVFLCMKYGDGYNYDEIGNEFNITSNTVSNRVNYIKSKVKACNDGEIYFDE